MRFVKQNLNKHTAILNLEFELRPNNNDLSVMSIIQGRRMTLGQSKPGLVVVGLEEMPDHDDRAIVDPNQLATCQLISQRFNGRKGCFRVELAAPRNSAQRGISGDVSIIPLFTSNYKLNDPCLEALQKLDMFRNLKSIEVTAVSGEDRIDFANKYLCHCIDDRDLMMGRRLKIQLDIPLGEGDTRPLVRHLRMIAFYVCVLLNDGRSAGLDKDTYSEVSIVQTGDHCHLSTTRKNSMELKVGKMGNLSPLALQSFDPRVGTIMDALRDELDETASDLLELSVILDFWLARTLAPAVIVSNDAQKIHSIVSASGRLQGINVLPGIEAATYKMMKSLYDPSRTPNLRDDILRFGRGASVVIGLRCDSAEAQLCIREIIEDTPSLTAFSTDKSALFKAGLLFAVHVKGVISPEIRSRASLIL